MQQNHDLCLIAEAENKILPNKELTISKLCLQNISPYKDASKIKQKPKFFCATNPNR